MAYQPTQWTKKELMIYILLMCANADNNQTEEELKMIKSKTDKNTFDKIYQEFKNDNEDTQFEKVDDTVQRHRFENIELINMRKEMFKIFFSDCNFSRMEKNLDRIMDNIIY